MSDRYEPLPTELDPPSLAPLFSAVGTAVTCWGIVTSNVILLTGLGILLFGLRIWIKELIHERN